MAMYGKVSYWDQRYRSQPDESHEWYQDFKSLRHLLNPYYYGAQGTTALPTAIPRPPAVGNTPTSFVSPAAGAASALQEDDAKPRAVPLFPTREKCRVLVLGCGNSRFSEEMCNDNWKGPIVNIDFSTVVIDQMKQKYDKKPGYENLQFLCADMTAPLPFEYDSFDLIVSKGSFDAVLCSAGSVASIRRLVQECVRVLATGHGIFFLVTTQNPDNRLVYLEHDNDLSYYWHSVSTHHVDRPHTPHTPPSSCTKSDFVYICRKRFTKAEPDERKIPAVTTTDAVKENQETLEKRASTKVNPDLPTQPTPGTANRAGIAKY